MSNDLREAALRYHRAEPAGKLEIAATKPMATQRDLALAYSPGVAYACTEIAEDPSKAAELTARGNMVAVITNGTAVLGLGAIGPLASKPVMEGKSVLFKNLPTLIRSILKLTQLMWTDSAMWCQRLNRHSAEST